MPPQDLNFLHRWSRLKREGSVKPRPARAPTFNPPEKDLTRKEAQTEMPTPGQANDHSSTARETVPSGR